MIQYQLPYTAVVGLCGLLGMLIVLLGVAVMRSREHGNGKSESNGGGGGGSRAMVPDLLEGGQMKASAIQPGIESHPMLAKTFGLFKSNTVPQVDPDVPKDENYLGKINFRLSYNTEAHTFSVLILEAKDLPAMDVTGTSDPYVRVCLLPGHNIKTIGSMTLCIQVMDYDRFSRDDPIGEILVPMKHVKLSNDPVFWKHLQKPVVDKLKTENNGHGALTSTTSSSGDSPRSTPRSLVSTPRFFRKNEDNSLMTAKQEYIGEVMVSLCFLPQSNRLTVVVIKARNLPAKDVNGSSDPYVKLWLVQYHHKLEKHKTSVKNQTLSPTYNESFAFTLPSEISLEKDVQLVVTVMDHDLLSSNDEIGHVVIGGKGSDLAAKHWKEVLDHPEHPCAMWHKLSPKW